MRVVTLRNPRGKGQVTCRKTDCDECSSISAGKSNNDQDKTSNKDDKFKNDDIFNNKKFFEQIRGEDDLLTVRKRRSDRT